VRCTSTGRQCEGYVDLPPVQKRASSSKYGSTSKALSLYRPSLDVSEDTGERQSFQYFRFRIAPAISSYFETKFWDSLLLQASHVEPAVRHALIALSSLHKGYELNRTNLGNINTSEAEFQARFALQQYTKAIGLLTPNNTSNQSSLQSILISCILFVWIEFLQGNLDTALYHLRGGLQVLRGLQQRSSIPNIDSSLPRLFRRLHTQASLHGSPTSDFNSTVSEEHINLGYHVPQNFSSIFEARESMDTSLHFIFRFMRRMYNHEFVASTMKRHPFPDPNSIEATVQHYLNNLRTWQTAFQRIPSLIADPPNGNQAAGITLLQLQHVTVTIMLNSLLETSEMAFDQYRPDFERMVSLAERLINNSQYGGLLVLSLDNGVILPLFMVALKCRYLGIRKRAIALLKQAPDREGICHRDSCIEFAEWKVQIEERRRGVLPETEPLPEMARIYNESAREVVMEGKLVTIVRFKRGLMDRIGENEFEEEITTLGAKLGELI
jgi:Fungal specific transcription factor domain